MSRYKRTLLALLLVTLVGSVSYISINGFRFSSESINNGQPKYSQVRIFTLTENDYRKIEDVGLHIDHAINKPGHYQEAWLSEYELSLIHI